MFMAQAKLQTKLCLNNTDLPKKGVFLSYQALSVKLPTLKRIGKIFLRNLGVWCDINIYLAYTFVVKYVLQLCG